MTRLSRTFGYQSVEENEREQRIRRVFEAVARRYDLMNDLMSMGIHRLWKRTLVRLAAPRAGQLIVDLAGGTGDVAARLAAADRVVAVCDPSVPMMQAGRARGHRHVQWLAGTGENMPLPGGSVDTITIAFGIRNVTRIEDALAEALRVLKPGGRFLCLEFSTPWAPVRPFYNFFSFAVIPRLGAMVAQAPEAYTYLVESIRRFPDQRSFQALMQQAGFGDVSYRNLSLGIACIHVGTKPAPAGKGSR
ncbi:MAG TPA: class I SAM-dependent methyltransferase [Rubrivivax sp.]|jgi:demethylmenaquinone methyltransferase/2-methoxy-6-polyprenyl-1,4-benzoquinol methylase|nr:class I SAM-dependent methyltransferase [Betaproteobacteria bacterium]MBK8104821.1 class I SAM-dependent methyltransferase [Betaproteobacteria bacterium]MBL0295729.1 class I SAM-dependent methyltransferase [Betaproteobacteria bacterium]HRC36753.1 class I SAM-dependent methyltransferase [Rubrivivax sp.]